MWRTKKPYLDLLRYIQNEKKKMLHKDGKARCDARKSYEKLLKQKKEYEENMEKYYARTNKPL